jgi:hypothetical protein
LIAGASPARLHFALAARQRRYLPGASAGARLLLKLADLAALEAAGCKVTCISGVAHSLNFSTDELLDRRGDDRAVGTGPVAIVIKH